MRLPSRQTIGYIGVLVFSFLLAMAAGYTALGRQIDADAYDWMFRAHQPAEAREPESALLAIDETTLLETGGVRGLRRILAEGLERVAPASPRVVAVDLTLVDKGDPGEDRLLEAAMKSTTNLVLAAELMPQGKGWQEPLPEFRRWAAGIGHVHAAPDELDGVNRRVPLELASNRVRYWAMALEAYRLSRGIDRILESPDDLRAGKLVIPARRASARTMSIRYLPAGPDGATAIPRVTIGELRKDPALASRFRDKVVFVGVTAQSAARDRVITPVSSGSPMPGVEVHANAFETLARGRFLAEAPNFEVLVFCALLAASAGVVFRFLSGWPAYASGGLLLVLAHALPYQMFAYEIVFPYAAPLSAAWLSVAGAASYQHFVVRRQLRKAEAEKTRYQQAVHFVTHEMRTPLTAIQGSSELMSRYNLSDDKRKEIAGLIHSESRRLARMIETFLNVERLSAGEMELKREPFQTQEMIEACLERARPLAERKKIRLEAAEIGDQTLVGDRELMEYACYNLVSNAIKYSPSGTQVTVAAQREGSFFRFSVKDQGIGMDEKELQNIFRKFYRTRKAIASGEAGTGIGLSIVQQIITHHGGKIEVSSAPGKGSCFTLVLPASVSATAEK